MRRLYCVWRMADIARLLGDGRVVGSKKEGQSAVWRNFKLLFFKESGEYTGYVLCTGTACKNPLKHDTSTSGTTHLKDHIKACSKKKKDHAASTSASTKITSYFETKQKIPQAVKIKVTDACVQFVAGDIRPFSAVEGVEFQNLIDCCIEVGAGYGKVKSSELLPSRNTVKWQADKNANIAKMKIMEHVKAALHQHFLIGMTT